jgi:hypothetical protein
MARALKDYPHIEHVATYELPPEFNQEIGAAMVRWGYYERSIQRIIWLLVGGGETIGRYAVREPRITERIEMIGDLAAMRSLTFDRKRLNNIVKLADWALRTRDLAAHGIWGKSPDGTWIVENTRGQHAKDDDVPHRSRRSFPGAVIMNITELQRLTKTIEKLIADAKALEMAVQNALQPSPENSF